MPFINATFSALPILLYVVKSTSYESHWYTMCLPSCHFLSCLCVLPYTTHITSLIFRRISQFMYFLYETLYTSCEAVTAVLVGIQAFQNVTQQCLDLLLDKYLQCGQQGAQILHNLRWTCYSVSSVFHNSNMNTLGTVYCACIHLFITCGYLSSWQDVYSSCSYLRGLPDMEGSCQYVELPVVDVWQRVVLQPWDLERG